MDRVTPIDELLKRFVTEGMKVLLGDDPETGLSFIMPAGSDDLVADSLLPRHLQINDEMNEKLKQLITLNRIRN